MADTLLQSLENLEEMLKGISNEPMIQPHNDENAEPEPEKEEEVKEEVPEENPACIKNGAYVRVERDGMKAWLYLNPPKKGEDYYSRDLIMQFLTENNVLTGFHTSNIAAIAKKHVYEREILVAQGVEPREGKNGYYEFFFDTSDKRKPEIREDGTVDYTSMSQLTNVEAGKKVAEYHHSTPAQNGYTVSGKELKARPSKDLPLLKGHGITNEANPDIYYATLAGKIDYCNGHVDIKDVHEITGDVDLVVGKIDFIGDIHISGSVGTGVIIRSSRNVFVDGVVEAAEIYAGGDVVLARGIQGNQKGHIVARGNVSAEFIEHANVECGENVRANSFINANIYAGAKVLAEGKNGQIIGGSIRGLKGVSASNIGNDVETKTYIACGYSSEDYENYVEVFQKENDVQKELSDTVERMTAILKQKRLGKDVLQSVTDKELEVLNSKKDKLFSELDAIRNQKEKLEEIIEKGKGSVILANDKIFRGVTICVEGTAMQIPANTSFMRYKNEAGRIVPSALVHS